MGSAARSASTTMYSIARAWTSDEKGTSVNVRSNLTCLVAIDQFVKAIACVTQFKEHVCIFDVVADLVIDDSGAIYEP